MTPMTLQVGDDRVSALWLRPPGALAALALAHGAGVGMAHPSMASLAEGLADRKVATLRFNFPYMERGSKRPDPPLVAHRAVRAAIAEAAKLAQGLPLFAGGRSFGGRMTSQAEALAPTSRLKGVVFFAFPLHPAGSPGVERAAHLAGVAAPMLFLQGTRDALADAALMRDVVSALGTRATLFELEGADHSFRAPAKSGGSKLEAALDRCRDWMIARS